MFNIRVNIHDFVEQNRQMKLIDMKDVKKTSTKTIPYQVKQPYKHYVICT